jgi:hypothetical protein
MTFLCMVEYLAVDAEFAIARSIRSWLLGQRSLALEVLTVVVGQPGLSWLTRPVIGLVLR